MKTEAIVLTVNPWRENDRRYSALTPDFGKLEFIGRGAQKPKAKLASHLEPFAVVDIEIVRGARSTTVIGVERTETFPHLADDPNLRMLALSALSLLDKTVRQDYEDAALFDELLLWLRFLDAGREIPVTRSTFVFGGFLLRLLRHLGYDIELGSCLSCKESVLPLAFRWHSGRGGLVCSDCALRQPSEWYAAHGLDEEVVTLLRFARDAGYEHLLRPSLRGEHVEEFAACVHDIFVYHVPGYAETPLWTGVALLP